MRVLRGIRSFAHAILLICKQYFKTPDIWSGGVCIQGREQKEQIEDKGKKTAGVNDSSGSPCVRRFELPTFWSVAKRSIQLS